MTTPSCHCHTTQNRRPSKSVDPPPFKNFLLGYIVDFGLCPLGRGVGRSALDEPCGARRSAPVERRLPCKNILSPRGDFCRFCLSRARARSIYALRHRRVGRAAGFPENRAEAGNLRRGSTPQARKRQSAAKPAMKRRPERYPARQR